MIALSASRLRVERATDGPALIVRVTKTAALPEVLRHNHFLLVSAHAPGLPLGFGGFFNTTFNPLSATVQNNTYVSGTFPTVYGVVRNDIFQRKAKLYSGGFNANWNPHNGWSGFLDFGDQVKKQWEEIEMLGKNFFI